MQDLPAPASVTIDCAVEHCMEAIRPLIAHSSFKSYRSYCRAFARWANAHGPREPGCPIPPGASLPIRALTTALLDAHLAYLLRLKPGSPDAMELRPRTIRAYWSACARFCKWLTENTIPLTAQPYLPANPFPLRRLPKLDQALRPRACESDVRAMLDACLNIENPYRRALSRCVIYLLFIGVMRKSEMLQIRMEHVHMDEDPPGILVYHGKGQKARQCPLPDEGVAIVREYLKLRPANAKHDYFLCHNNLYGRLADECLYDILRKAEEMAGLQPSKTRKPHAMRRGGAVMWLDRTKNIETVKRRLGHSNLTTTQLYTESNDSDVAKTRNMGALGLPPTSQPVPAPAAAQERVRTHRDRSLRKRGQTAIRRRLPPDRA